MKSTAHQGDQLTHVSGVWENPTLRLGFVPGRRMSSWQGWVPQLVMTLRSNLRSAGVEIVTDKSKTVDAVWVHEDQVSDSMLSDTCPLLVHSVSDVAQLYNRTRQLLVHPTVAAVTVQHAYRPRAIYNSREFSLGFHNTLFRECRPDLFPAEPGVSFKPLNPHQIDRIRVTFGYGAFRRLESLRQKPVVIEHHRDVDVHFAGTTRYRSPLVTQHRRLCVESIRQLRDRHRGRLSCRTAAFYATVLGVASAFANLRLSVGLGGGLPQRRRGYPRRLCSRQALHGLHRHVARPVPSRRDVHLLSP